MTPPPAKLRAPDDACLMPDDAPLMTPPPAKLRAPDDACLMPDDAPLMTPPPANKKPAKLNLAGFS